MRLIKANCKGRGSNCLIPILATGLNSNKIIVTTSAIIITLDTQYKLQFKIIYVAVPQI